MWTRCFALLLAPFALAAWPAAADPYADAVESFDPGTSGGFQQEELPDVVTGPPAEPGLFVGSTDVVSLGLEGTIVLRFDDNVIVDGPGVDFTVFENAFMRRPAGVVGLPFVDPGRVSVSQDGVEWAVFDDCVLDISQAPWYPGCAGVRPTLADGSGFTADPTDPTPPGAFEALVGQNANLVVLPPGSGGDSFDLADVGLAWARYVRIEAADFVDGPIGTDNAGFDLDAVAAVHSADGVPVPMLDTAARIALGLALAALGSRGIRSGSRRSNV